MNNESANIENEASSDQAKQDSKKAEQSGVENGPAGNSEPSTSGIVQPAGMNPTLHLQNLMKTLGLHRKAPPHEFQFWSTQPVPNIDENIDVNVNEAVEPDKEPSEIRQDPYNLPGGFSWSTLNLNDATELEALYTLLNENYVEDDDNMFRFDYRKEFLRWALMPPGFKKEWHVGVRVTKSGKLMGFISAIPAEIRIYEKTKKVVEINFLCVHKKLRSKRLAPVLIKEVTRRVHLSGIFQATYTAGVILPKPVASCRYWHRSLNPKKLIDIKFSQLGVNMTMQRTLKLFKLPETTQTKGFRKVEDKDMKQCHKLLTEYFKNFQLTPCFTFEDFKHWFSPKPEVVNSYLIENDGKVTDFVSFYTLPSTVVNHPVHKILKAAYSFYNVSTTTPLKALVKDALISAKNENYDVFNALDLMDNEEFLEDLRFGKGDGNLQYYLYNWRCPEMEPNKVGLVLQ